MNDWALDILRQGGWDWWTLLCAVASLVLLSYALVGKPWHRPHAVLSVTLIAIGVGGTLLILIWPRLHDSRLGLVWTFLLLTILSATFYLNIHAHLGTTKLATLLTLRTIALGLMVLMFFEPILRRTTTARPEQPLLFLVDTSGSMSFPDEPNGPTRLQRIWQTLRPELSRINQRFQPRYFTFDTSLRELKKPDDLARIAADGKATDLAGALIQISDKSARADAVTILISDGIDNVSPNVIGAIGPVQKPINTLLVGSEQAEPSTLANVAVENVDSPDQFVVGHESTLKATIKSTALANRVVDVNLAAIDDSGKVTGEVTSKKLVLQPLPEGQSVELLFTPRSVGVQKLAIWIDPIPGERSLLDNRQEFQGLAIDPRIKVLYVEGRSRPEYKSLRLALLKDPNIEASTLLRKTQNQFEAAGSVDGQPFSAMPIALDQWKKFDVIILGDLDVSFLTAGQQSAIEQFVSGGGGLLMIGGQNNFGPGGYADTPIERALPVFAGDKTSPQETSQFVPRLTDDGAIHPAMEGLSDWFGVNDKPGTKILPPLRGNVVVPKPKAGAQVLLTHSDRPGPDGKPQIVLAVERDGKGRSAAFTVDTTYLWDLPLSGLGQESPYKRFWGQLIRWLAGEDVRNRQRGPGLEGLLNKSLFQMGESVKVRAMVRDQKGDATPYAQVTMNLHAPLQVGGRPQPLSPVESHRGMYDATLDPPAPGDYVIDLIATKDGKELGRVSLKFSVIAPAEEMLKLAANPALLEKIASRHPDGSYRELSRLPDLLDSLISRQTKKTLVKQESVKGANTIGTLMSLLGHEPTWPDKYDLPMQGGLIVLLLATEWALRRRWRLA